MKYETGSDPKNVVQFDNEEQVVDWCVNSTFEHNCEIIWTWYHKIIWWQGGKFISTTEETVGCVNKLNEVLNESMERANDSQVRSCET